MFRIGEFSRLTQVSIRMLRYYDQNGLLRPAFIDPQTGYRLYTAEQIPRLQRIRLLRDLDFNVAEIARALPEWEGPGLEARLEEKRVQTEAELRQVRARLKKLEDALADARSQRLPVHCNITLRHVPAFPILSLRGRIPDYWDEGRLWEQLYEYIQREKPPLAPGGRNVAIFHQELGPRGADVEVGLEVTQLWQAQSPCACRMVEEVEQMACIMVYGDYGNIGAAYQAFGLWLADHGPYTVAGPSRVVCHIEAGSGAAPAEYLTEIQVPVKEDIGLDSHTV